jgi:HSP20 family protein
MRSRTQAVVLPSEAGEFTDDVRRLFQELGRTAGELLVGECAPALDVYETDENIEITMDVPAVSHDAVRIVAKGQAVLIAGVKAPRRGRGDSSFHLVERGYGRFARVVRLTTPCDTGRARATIANGELRITLPKVQERRGRAYQIAINGPSESEP